MADTARFLAFDLGAESGRAVLGTLKDGKLELTEIHRFANEPQFILDRFYWDTTRLFAEIKRGLALCVRNYGAGLDGLGVDTWGVDFALLDDNDELLGLPRHYRDARTDGMLEEAFGRVPREEIYRQTGIQFMKINSLFQLLALAKHQPRTLEAARALLFTPDLLNFWLTGRKTNEFSIVTTSQCYDPSARDWARPLMDRLGIPTHLLGEIVPAGAVIGPLHPCVMRETGAGAVPVIAPATHDTGSAVAAVPVQGQENWAYISCGTWSLVGIEAKEPILNERSLAYNLTNEGGYGGTFRILRNVMGLWILQRCRAVWERQGQRYEYAQLAAMAAEAPAFRTIIDPDDDLFLNPPDMTAAIAEYARRTQQPAPVDVAGTVRCIVESLALKYRWVLERIQEASGRTIDTVYVIGGGCQNQLLCQSTADATNRRVLAGPIEATAIGNLLVQALATGHLSSLDEARGVVANSFPMCEHLPANSAAWEEPYARLSRLVG